MTLADKRTTARRQDPGPVMQRSIPNAGETAWTEPGGQAKSHVCRTCAAHHKNHIQLSHHEVWDSPLIDTGNMFAPENVVTAAACAAQCQGIHHPRSRITNRKRSPADRWRKVGQYELAHDLHCGSHHSNRQCWKLP